MAGIFIRNYVVTCYTDYCETEIMFAIVCMGSAFLQDFNEVSTSTGGKHTTDVKYLSYKAG